MTGLVNILWVGDHLGGKRCEFIRANEIVVLERGFVYLTDEPVLIRTVSTCWIECLGLCRKGVVINILSVVGRAVWIIEWCMTTCKQDCG